MVRGPFFAVLSSGRVGESPTVASTAAAWAPAAENCEGFLPPDQRGPRDALRVPLLPARSTGRGPELEVARPGARRREGEVARSPPSAGSLAGGGRAHPGLRAPRPQGAQRLRR